MARDGLLPRALATVSSRGSPVRIIFFTVRLVGTIAGIFLLDEIAALANAVTFAAFIAVAGCMLIMRRRAPDAPRAFRTPLPWLVEGIAMLGCIYLFLSLPSQTQIHFVVWNVIGLVAYAICGSRHALAR